MNKTIFIIIIIIIVIIIVAKSGAQLLGLAKSIYYNNLTKHCTFILFPELSISGLLVQEHYFHIPVFGPLEVFLMAKLSSFKIIIYLNYFKTLL